MGKDLTQDARILRIREKKAREGLSCQAITDKTEALGRAVSITTVKKICCGELPTSSVQPSTLAALEDAVGIERDDQEEKLTEEVHRLEERLKATDELLKARTDQLERAHDTINDYKVQIASMRETVKTYQAAIKRKNKLLRILVVMLGVLALLAVVLFATDMLTPSLGFFRRLL